MCIHLVVHPLNKYLIVALNSEVLSTRSVCREIIKMVPSREVLRIFCPNT